MTSSQQTMWTVESGVKDQGQLTAGSSDVAVGGALLQLQQQQQQQPQPLQPPPHPPLRQLNRSSFNYIPTGQSSGYNNTQQPPEVGVEQSTHPYNPPSRRGSQPIPINTTDPLSASGRSFRVASFLSPSTASARSASHPYNIPLPPSTARSMMARDDGRTPSPSIGSFNPSPTGPPTSAVLAYNPGTLNNGLKVSPRRRRPPAFPSSPRSIRGAGVSMASPTDYCQTPAILRVPHSPREGGSLPSSSYAYYQTPITPSPSSSFSHLRGLGSPLGVPISNVRGEISPSFPPCTGGFSGPSYSRGRERRTSAINRQTAKLEGVPWAYVVKSLRKLAPNFWGKVGTADVRIQKNVVEVVIPIRHNGQLTPSPTTSLIDQMQSPQTSNTQTMASGGQPQPDSAITPSTASSPAFPPPVGGVGVPGVDDNPTPFPARVTGTPQPVNEKKMLTFLLHTDYLITQSTLLQSLLSPASPPQPYYTDPSVPERIERESPSTGLKIKGARIVVTPIAAPTTVWLPLPDPGSFGVIAHWMYWGHPATVEGALSGGQVSWQGIVKNIEYLGLDDSIKKVIGIWWRRWVKVEAGRGDSGGGKTIQAVNVGLRRRSERNDENMSDDGMDEENAEEGDDEAEVDGDDVETRVRGIDSDGGDELKMAGLMEAL